MKRFLEPEKNIPVTYEVDVLVIGAGPAGISAAISAAREGASVLLVEQSGDVGGIATVGLMSHWTGETKGGFYNEILERTSDKDIDDKRIIDTERSKTEMLNMLAEANVKLLLYTFACEAIVEDNILKGAIIENKSGRQAIFAKITIDASGDGDIAAKSGAPFFKGREEDGKMQPVTIMFRVGGVDYDRAVFPCCFEDNLEIPKGLIQDLGKANIKFPAGHVLLYKSTLPGIVNCNMTNSIDVDGVKTEDLTAATLQCRNQIEPIVKFLREYVPGYENCYVISSASLIGVRETRHFKGEYVLTADDVKNAASFDDWVVTSAHFGFDVHNMSGPGLDATGVQAEFNQKKSYEIPYGSLIPLDIENLILAGRNISGSHLAHASYRVMPICANVGMAAGIAAAISAKENLYPRNLPVTKLQEILTQRGVKRG